MNNFVSLACGFCFLIFSGNCVSDTAESKIKSDYAYMDVTGSGDSDASAISNALIRGSRLLIGAYVYKNTIHGLENVATLDVISKFDTLAIQRQANGKVYARIRAYYKQSNIDNNITAFNLKPFQRNIDSIAFIKARQDQLREARGLLESLVGHEKEFFEAFYSLEYNGYVVEEIGADFVKGYVAAYLSMNPVFWSHYRRLLVAISKSEAGAVKEGLFSWQDGQNLKSTFDDPGGPSACGGTIWGSGGIIYYYIGQTNAVNVNGGLVNSLVKPIKITIDGIPGVSSFSAIIFKNFVGSKIAAEQMNGFAPMMRDTCPIAKWFASGRPILRFSSKSESLFRGTLFDAVKAQPVGQWVKPAPENSAVDIDVRTGLIKIPFKVPSERELESLPTTLQPKVEFYKGEKDWQGNYR